jgi:asparagine synthase (glutamine-hydrolysing)
MSGIAGAIHLSGPEPLAPPVLTALAAALAHRGPDGEAFFDGDGVHLAERRWSIDGWHALRYSEGRDDLAGAARPSEYLKACHPAHHADAHVIFDGALLQTGEPFLSDAEHLARLWQQHGERMLERLQGQFAFALWDARDQRLILARDRFGICPLHWTRQGDWLLFASEIKALIASGMVPVRPDRGGINHIFTFFGQPGPATCFEGVSALLPGRFLDIRTGSQGRRTIQERVYWDLDFPNRGEEESGDANTLTDRLDALLQNAVAKRLPDGGASTVCYLSGGVDSGIVTALTAKALGHAPPAFSVRITDAQLDESSLLQQTAAKVGCVPNLVAVGTAEVLAAYPRLVRATECPVIDTACAALLMLSEEVQRRGFKVAMTGEGADEWLASYPWYKLHKALGMLDVIPGVSVSSAVKRLFLRLSGAPQYPRAVVNRSRDALGGPSPWLDMYGLYSLNKLRFFNPELRDYVFQHNPYEDLALDLPRMARWHPLHRAVYVGAKVQLPGLLLHAKGDRIAMSAGVQQRYIFLDDDVCAFLAGLHPRWKLKGFTDKYLLRLVAERHLPRDIAWRKKDLFRAPFEGFHVAQPPRYVEQLFSPESIRKAGYFDPQAVAHFRQQVTTMRPGSAQRSGVEMGLAAVFSTQLWHHTFVDRTLCDLPADPA